MAGNDIIVTIFFKISDPLTDGTVMNRDDFCDLLGRHASLEELEGEAVAFSFGFTGEGAGVGAGHQRDLSCQVPSGKRSTSLPSYQSESHKNESYDLTLAHHDY